MTPLDKQEPEQEAQGASDISKDDAEIVIRMGVQMLNGGGLEQIQAAIDQSKDPATVIGTFLAQMMGQMAEQLQSQINLDPRVFLAKGGFLDHMLDYIERKLGYPAEFSDQVYSAVLETVKAAAMKPPAPNNVMEGGGQPPQLQAGGQPNV